MRIDIAKFGTCAECGTDSWHTPRMMKITFGEKNTESIFLCLECYKQMWRIDKAKTEAHSMIEDAIDTLIEVGNGTTDEMLHDAAGELIKARDILFP